MSDAPIRIGFPDSPLADACGCCDGAELMTVRPSGNRPDLTAIAFRAGTHGDFKASMQTALSSSAFPALKTLGTRDDDDFSIALIDAWASACDVLTFYQERLANEAYMGTATERFSIGELARLIGYRLHPGSAAETDLVILMDDPPGAEPDVTDLEVPEGTRVQSQPGPDEDAQIFETVAPLLTRVAWNTLRPRLGREELPGNNDTEAWLQGTPALQTGDAVVFVDRDRWDTTAPGFDATSNRWQFRRLTEVTPSADGKRTRIAWSGALANLGTPVFGPEPSLRLFHLRERASFFGYNAPHPLVLTPDQRDGFGFSDATNANSPSTIGGNASAPTDWIFDFPSTSRVHLDAVYKSIVTGSWVVLRRAAGANQLYRVSAARESSRAAYAISGKTTRLDLDTEHRIGLFDRGRYRGTSIYGASDELNFSEVPRSDWVAGDKIELEGMADGLPENRRLIFRGKRARVAFQRPSGTLEHADGAVQSVLRGEVLTLLDAPEDLGGGSMRFPVRNASGFSGTVTEAADAFRPAPAPKDAETIAVAAVLKQAVRIGTARQRLDLVEALGTAFDRESLVIHANVARAAHGEGATEILGHGDPQRPFQKFKLKQAPVTHRLAPTETGVESTLSLRVDGVEWQEVPDLYQRGASARVFKTSLTDTGETVVEFGDGVSGARPMAGRDNIVADYSKGIGAAGNLRAGQLTLPLDRPLGLREVGNPLPASGGSDPERTASARKNAALYTLTLGRVVSVTDYRDFALGFPGIEKAEARWIWRGEETRIIVTVAGEEGETLPPGSTTHDNLLKAFRKLGDPLASFELHSYVPAHFRLRMRVKVDPAFEADVVLGELEAALFDAFSFDKRDFAQPVALSEVAEVAHLVAGVVAVDIDRLRRETGPQTGFRAYPRLVSRTARLNAGGTLHPAEILMLSQVRLEEMT